MGVLTRNLFQVVEYVKRGKVPSQAGIISGANPTVYNATDPFPLWVIQVVIIVCFTQLLGMLFKKIRQPRVIAEVIGGIILGPTVMGRIPGFTNSIFPAQSIQLLTLTSTFGLVLFLFLIGLEVDIRLLRRNAKYSMAISAAGMMLPFALGVGLAVAIYHEFVSSTVSFGHFVLFVGVAVAITAFPVLCRILSDLNLLEDHVGVIVLSAGVGNDVVGWILLALAVALTNASSGIEALWILLVGAAFVLFMVYPGRWTFAWLARRTGSLENGTPSPLMMTLTLLMILASAFFTDVIGIHPIFGGFIAGLIVPHEGGFAIALVEKLEDLVCIVFLPIYFILSGLRTNLGLLNTGISWAYIVLICVIAFFGKFIGCALTAKLLGFSNRESSAIGTLMSCKGLVELIVLNVGLQAGILDTRVFSMFVVHAIVLTVMTTPLTLWCYPEQHRTGRDGREAKAELAKNVKVDHQHHLVEQPFISRFSVVLNKIEHLPAIMTIMQLLQTTPKPSIMPHESGSIDKDLMKGDGSRDITQEKDVHPDDSPPPTPFIHRPITINALRVLELTDRTSTVMRSSEADEEILRDPLISVFSTFGRLLNLAVSSHMSIGHQDSFATTVAAHSRDNDSHMVIIPWQVTTASHGGGLPETPSHNELTYNPFDGMYRKPAGVPERAVTTSTSVVYENFVRKVFAESPVDVALFVDRGMPASRRQHIFFPFFGGPDDRLALRFVVQLCSNSGITATVVRVRKSVETKTDGASVATEDVKELGSPVLEIGDTVYATQSTQTRIASEAADNLIWSRYASNRPESAGGTLSLQTRGGLWHATFSEISSPMPLRAIIERASHEATEAVNHDAKKSLLLVCGRSRQFAVESHLAELNSIIAELASSSTVSVGIAKTVGEVAAGFMAASTNASGILVLQAADSSF